MTSVDVKLLKFSRGRFVFENENETAAYNHVAVHHLSSHISTFGSSLTTRTCIG